MSLSEVVFREDYHRSLLERLSPGLLSVVAQHNLARVVVQLPFYVDTIKRAHGRPRGGSCPSVLWRCAVLEEGISRSPTP